MSGQLEGILLIPVGMLSDRPLHDDLVRWEAQTERIAWRTSVPSKSKDLSRRVFLQRVATYGAGAAIIQGFAANFATAQAKVPQNTVSYQDKPKGPQRCDGCNNFQPPNACKMVDGVISPQGWCTLFVKKA